jgi:hypothetical protein
VLLEDSLYQAAESEAMSSVIRIRNVADEAVLPAELQSPPPPLASDDSELMEDIVRNLKSPSYGYGKGLKHAPFVLSASTPPAPGFRKTAAGIPGNWKYGSEYIKAAGEPQLVWMRKKCKSFFDPPSLYHCPAGKVDQSRCLEHFCDFLARRPLASIYEQWAAEKIAYGGETLRPLEQYKTPTDDTYAKAALDLLDLDGITSALNEWVRMPFKPNEWLDALIGGSHPIYRRTFHGTKLQALYCVLYHGNLAPSLQGTERGGGYRH